MSKSFKLEAVRFTFVVALSTVGDEVYASYERGAGAAILPACSHPSKANAVIMASNPSIMISVYGARVAKALSDRVAQSVSDQDSDGLTAATWQRPSSSKPCSSF